MITTTEKMIVLAEMGFAFIAFYGWMYYNAKRKLSPKFAKDPFLKTVLKLMEEEPENWKSDSYNSEVFRYKDSLFIVHGFEGIDGFTISVKQSDGGIGRLSLSLDDTKILNEVMSKILSKEKHKEQEILLKRNSERGRKDVHPEVLSLVRKGPIKEKMNGAFKRFTS